MPRCPDRPNADLPAAKSVPDPPTDRRSRNTPSPSTTVGSMVEAIGSSAAMPGRTRLRAARNGRNAAASSSVRSRTASISAWATGRSDPPLSMARPISTTNPRRRASAAHSVTRRVLPIPASPVRTANPPVPTSARPNACRPVAPTPAPGQPSSWWSDPITTTGLHTARGVVPRLALHGFSALRGCPMRLPRNTSCLPPEARGHEHITPSVSGRGPNSECSTR